MESYTTLSTASTKLRVALILAATLALPIYGCSKTPADQAQEAVKAMERGDRPTAVIRLKDAIQQQPDNAEYRYLLATVYNSMGDGLSAEKELRKATELGLVKGGRVVAELGRALLIQNSLRKLLTDVTPNNVYEPEPLAMVHALRGRAMLPLNQVSGAAAEYAEAVKLAPNAIDVMVLQALLETPKNNLAEAIKLLDATLARYPNNLDVMSVKFDVLRAQKNEVEALALVSTIIAQEPALIKPRLARAQMSLRLRKPEEAQKDIDAVRKVSRGNAFVLYTQGLIYFSTGKYREAQTAVLQSLKISPDFAPARLLSGVVHYTLGAFSQAEQALTTLNREFPNDPLIRKVLAATLVANNDGKRALEVIEPELGKELQDSVAMQVAGDAYMAMGAYGKAADLMERASAMDPQSARLRTAAGVARLGEGEFDKAVVDLEAATQLQGGADRPDVLLILTLLGQKNTDKALAAALNLQKKQPKNPLAHNLLGVVYEAKQDAANARASFERALSLKPDYLAAAENLARMDLADKKPDAAQKRIEGVLAVNKNNVQAMLLLAELAASRGDTKGAIQVLEGARKASPTAIEPRSRLAAYYLHMGEKEKALEIAREAVAANPQHPTALQMLGMVQSQTGETGSATASYSKAVAMTPRSALAWNNLGSSQVAAKQFTEAEKSYRKAIDLQPDFVQAQMALGALYLLTKRPDEALKVARAAQKKYPKRSDPFTLEGDALAQTKKYPEAIKAYESSLRLTKSGTLAVKIYMVRAASAGAEPALQGLAAWVKENPKDLEARSFLADGLLSVRQLKPAVEQYEVLTKSAPGNAMVLNNYASALHQLKDPRALDVAEKAYKIAPGNPLVADTLAWILLEKGNTARALELLRTAATTLPHPEIRYHLGVALARSGDKVAAKRELEDLLRSNKPFPQQTEAKELLGKL